jgi:hypothetical protein
MSTPSKDERDSFQVLTELFARDVDGALLDENLKLTPEQRLLKLEAMMRFTEEARSARAAAIPAEARRRSGS